jgi:hypothetical protein
MNLNDELARFVEENEIPVYGIASTDGFKRALPGWHPKE